MPHWRNRERREWFVVVRDANKAIKSRVGPHYFAEAQRFRANTIGVGNAPDTVTIER